MPIPRKPWPDAHFHGPTLRPMNTTAPRTDITIYHNNRCSNSRRALALLRDKEAVFAELGLGDASVSDAQLIAAVAEPPVLLNRPIVVTPKGAALCRPPEKVLALI